MSSSALWLFGLISITLLVLATFKAAKRRRENKGSDLRQRNTPHLTNIVRTRPLILPWLVSENNSLDSVVFNKSDVAGSPYCVTVQAGDDLEHHPYPNHYFYLSYPPPIQISSRTPEFLPPYIEYQQPKLAEPSYKKRLPLESKISRNRPISRIPSLPVLPITSFSEKDPTHINYYDVQVQDNSEVQEYPSCNLERLAGPERLTVTQILQTPKSTDFEESDSSFNTSCTSWEFSDSQDSVFSSSNRDSTSSISTSITSLSKNFDCDNDEIEDFQRLGIVLGSGSRLQAHYGILTKSNQDQKGKITLTPIFDQKN